jgi:hypothetical protein
MRLAVIDASPLGGGPVTHALARAVDELPDATVVRMRSFDLFGRVCSSCAACARTGRCTRHDAAIDEALATLEAADALLIGCPGHVQAQDARCRALLERLVGAFGDIETARGVERSRPRPALRKRAALLCGAPPLLGVPAMLGMLPSGASGVWRMLERSGAAVVGCASVGSQWAGPASRDRAGDSARRIGCSLASSASPHPERRTWMQGPRRIASSLLGVVRSV